MVDRVDILTLFILCMSIVVLVLKFLNKGEQFLYRWPEKSFIFHYIWKLFRLFSKPYT